MNLRDLALSEKVSTKFQDNKTECDICGYRWIVVDWAFDPRTGKMRRVCFTCRDDARALGWKLKVKDFYK